MSEQADETWFERAPARTIASRAEIINVAFKLGETVSDGKDATPFQRAVIAYLRAIEFAIRDQRR